MKNLLIASFVAVIFIFQYSCKQITKDIIDCSFETIGASVTAEEDTETKYKVNFTFNFDTSDGETISTITWKFGDGQSIVTQTATASHTYAESGDYDVVVEYTINMDGGTCSSTKNKKVSVSE